MAEAAGYLLIAIAILHLGSGLLWVDRTALRARVRPPWQEGSLLAQRDFWSQLGSFAAPLGLIGGLVAWTSHRGVEPPAWLGWLVLAWALACALRLPRGGFWLMFVPAALLIAASVT
jgi:hypothetical protein